jgi:3-hydroxyacyl-[acyl-carrier-protein] dehydratase
VLLDHLTSIERGQRAAASATFSPDLELFADHFPGQPIVPGVLLTEAMCQTAGWLIAASCDFSGWPLLVRIDRANFRRVVTPGESLSLEATLTASRDETYEISGKVTIHGDTVADARLLFKLFRFDLAIEQSVALNTWGLSTFERLNGPTALLATARQS